MSCQDHDAKSKILELIDESRRIFYEVYNVENFSEEDVKVKLIFPLFEILGWNVRNHREAVMEAKDSDETIEEKLLKRPSPKKKSIKIDCIFKDGTKSHIFLESKHLRQRNLPSPGTPDGQRIIAYAQKWKAKYVVFTNFLQMLIVETETMKMLVFKDMSEYISRFDQLKILMKPCEREGYVWKREPEKCFENFEDKPQCSNCFKIQRSICEATTNLKRLGYQMQSF